MVVEGVAVLGMDVVYSVVDGVEELGIEVVVVVGVVVEGKSGV